MNIFQVYKIILGLIVSGFVIFFISNFLGDYVGLNTQTMTYKILNEFRDEVNNVYFSGDSSTFSELSKRGIPECFIKPSQIGENSMQLKCGSISVSIFTPLIFANEKAEISLNRHELDFGWTKFYMVSATPQLLIIFAPDSSAKETVLDITKILKENKNIKFATCDDLTNQMTGNMFYDFYNINPVYVSDCDLEMSDHKRIVKVSQICGPEDEICIKPPKTVYINNKELEYGDVLDLISVIISGAEKDVFGNSLGEISFNEKNKAFEKQIIAQINLETERAYMLKNEAETILQAIRENLDTIQETKQGIIEYDILQKYGYCENYYSNLNNFISDSYSRLQANYLNLDFSGIKDYWLNANNEYSEIINEISSGNIICPKLSSEAKMDLICSSLRFELVDILNNVKMNINDPHTLLDDSKSKYKEMEAKGC